MKLLHIGNWLGMGGAEKLLAETLPLYKAQGIDVELLLTTDIDTPLRKSLEQQVKIYTLPFRSFYDVRIIIKLIPFLREYHIIHVHLFPPLYFAALAKILARVKTKMIFTEHSTSNRRMNVFLRPFENFIYSQYDKIVCITDDVKSILQNHLKRKNDKFLTINNGINLTSIQKANPLERESISGINKEDFVLIMVAGFRIQKDHETLLKSLVLLDSKVKLLLVGDGERKQEIQRSILSKGLSKRVFLLGVRMDIPQLIKMCDIAILSSHWEGFGLVAVEAMASGKPFIASDVPGLREVVQGAGVLFPQGDEKALADEIMKLINNKQYYNEVAEKCVERAEKYDINIMVDKTIELYKSVLSEVK